MATKKAQLLELISDMQVQEYVMKKNRIEAINSQLDSLREEKEQLLSSMTPVEDTVKAKIAEVVDSVEKVEAPIEEVIG